MFVRCLLFVFRQLQFSRPPSLSIPCRSNGLQALSASPITVMASYLFLIWCVAPALALAVASILPSVAAELLMVGSYILPWMLYVQMSPGSSTGCQVVVAQKGTHLAIWLPNRRSLHVTSERPNIHWTARADLSRKCEGPSWTHLRQLLDRLHRGQRCRGVSQGCKLDDISRFSAFLSIGGFWGVACYVYIYI